MFNSPITGPCPMLSLGRCETRMVDNATLLFGRSSRPSLFLFLSAILLFCKGTVSKSFSRFQPLIRAIIAPATVAVQEREVQPETRLSNSPQLPFNTSKWIAMVINSWQFFWIEIARCVQIAAF